jgi:hypothetical protein
MAAEILNFLDQKSFLFLHVIIQLSLIDIGYPSVYFFLYTCTFSFKFSAHDFF